MKYPISARLNDEAMKVWGDVFPDRQVPILMRKKDAILLKPDGQPEPQTVFMVNLDLLDHTQRQKIYNIIADGFKAPSEKVIKEIHEKGLPLRSKFVSYVVINPRFLNVLNF